MKRKSGRNNCNPSCLSAYISFAYKKHKPRDKHPILGKLSFFEFLMKSLLR